MSPKSIGVTRDGHGDVTAAFKRYYMQNLAMEFAEDLDQIRNADDFNDGSMPVLVNALEQGTSIFTADEQRIVVGK